MSARSITNHLKFSIFFWFLVYFFLLIRAFYQLLLCDRIFGLYLLFLLLIFFHLHIFSLKFITKIITKRFRTVIARKQFLLDPHQFHNYIIAFQNPLHILSLKIIRELSVIIIHFQKFQIYWDVFKKSLSMSGLPFSFLRDKFRNLLWIIIIPMGFFICQ